MYAAGLVVEAFTCLPRTLSPDTTRFLVFSSTWAGAQADFVDASTAGKQLIINKFLTIGENIDRVLKNVVRAAAAARVCCTIAPQR